MCTSRLALPPVRHVGVCLDVACWAVVQMYGQQPVMGEARENLDTILRDSEGQVLVQVSLPQRDKERRWWQAELGVDCWGEKGCCAGLDAAGLIVGVGWKADGLGLLLVYLDGAAEAEGRAGGHQDEAQHPPYPAGRDGHTHAGKRDQNTIYNIYREYAWAFLDTII